MIGHYIKVAFRNLLKYKTQSVISIVGLAIGFACFALSAYWVQYEMTYDNFHKDADRIYLVRMDDSHFGGHYYNYVPYPLGNYLKTNYTEIEDFCAFTSTSLYVQKGKQLIEYPILMPDTTFLRMMDIKVLEGDNQFYLPTALEKGEIAITGKTANELFGTTTDVIGKTIIDGHSQHECRISAIVSDWGEHTNFKYAFMGSNNRRVSWDDCNHRMLIKVKPETDVSLLLDKMNRNFPKELKKNRYGVTGYTRFYLEPVTGLRYADQFVNSDQRVLQFKYIVYFSIIGVLVIICAFVNYLTIYSYRFRLKKREMALRKVNGASEGSLMALLSAEFMLTILLSSVTGMVLIELLMPSFRHYSMMEDADISLYGACLMYMAGMAAVAFIVALLSVYLMRRRSLYNTILSARPGWLGRIYQKGGIIVQLAVCLLFIFFSVVMQMQLHHLRHVNIGMEYRNRASLAIQMNVDMNVWAEKLKALPMVTEVATPKYWPLIARGACSSFDIDSWDGLDGTTENPIGMDEVIAGEEFFRFYNMQLLAGEWISEKSDVREVNIMETTARNLMGWTPEEAIGKHIYFCNKEVKPMTVVGVIKDCAYKSPTRDLPHTVFTNTHERKFMWPRCFVLFKYKPGTWDECRRRIEEMQQAEHPDKKLFLQSEEEKYDSYLSSEEALSTLLGFASAVCILISIFGIYSLVTLACEQRRKEIAIRKVNGAAISQILGMFFKEYILLLAVSALIAFPPGYALMKHWIETYNRQVEIGILPFVLIFTGIAVVIAFSIGWRVWQAAHENPAEVIKSE